MLYDPWTLIGWSIAALLLIAIMSAPFVAISVYRAHRRTVKAMADHRKRVEELRERGSFRRPATQPHG